MNRIEEIKKEMKAGIADVISGKADRLEIDAGVCPDMVKKHLVAEGYKCSDLETNGWQYDWWLHFTKDGKSFTAFGSGYYGTFEFSSSEE